MALEDIFETVESFSTVEKLRKHLSTCQKPKIVFSGEEQILHQLTLAATERYCQEATDQVYVSRYFYFCLNQ